LKNKDNISQKMGSSQNKNNSLTKSQLKSRDEKEEENNLIKKYEIKIVLLGDINVGKTSIVLRYSKNIFKNHYPPTIGGAYTQKILLLQNGILIKFHIWDTSGQERFRAMTNLYYRDAQVALLTYDITNESSFNSIDFWIQELKYKVENENMILCLVGNKCDVSSDERKISTAQGKKFAQENNMIFYETSAKTGEGVTDLFVTIANKVYEQQKK
jgi:Ras-related protein Rab-5C